MALYAVIEILDADKRPVADDDLKAEVSTLAWMERDRQADGYVNLDSDSYVTHVRIVGTLHDARDAFEISDMLYYTEPLPELP